MLQNFFMIHVFVLAGLLVMISNSPAQNGIWAQETNIPTPEFMPESFKRD